MFDYNFSENPLTSILGTGAILFFFSFSASYFWARDVDSTPASRQDPLFISAQTEQTDTGEETEEDDDDADTRELTPRSWELFLEFEGERREMLGVIRDYREVNLRNGPGTEYSIIETPPGGALLFPLDRYNQWFRARTEEGRLGWIHESVTRQLNVPLPVIENLEEEIDTLEEVTKQQIPPEFMNYNRVEIIADAVNLRAGPGLQFSIRTRLYQYEELRLLGRRENWFRVQNRHGATGWVYEETAEPVFLFNPERAYTLNEENLAENTLRSKPAHQFRGRHIPGEQFPVRLIGEIENWYQIKLVDGDIGWIPRATYVP